MKRYVQQMALPEIGSIGQQRLSNAKILVVGCGGLGVPLITYLAAMGVGNITVVDADQVEETNLHRQFSYTPNDIGQLKVDVLASRIALQNPNCTITAIQERFTNDSVFSTAFDLICDCSDNRATRIALNHRAIELKIPLVYAAVTGWTGYVTIFNGLAGVQLTDLHPTLESTEQPEACAISGVIPSVCGTIASIQATETVKLLLDIPSSLDGEVYAYNGLKNKVLYLRVRRGEKHS